MIYTPQVASVNVSFHVYSVHCKILYVMLPPCYMHKHFASITMPAVTNLAFTHKQHYIANVIS